MFEFILAIVMIVAVARIASTDDQSVPLWIAIAIGMLVLCGLIPIPYFRVLIAGILCYVTMIVYKVAFNK